MINTVPFRFCVKCIRRLLITLSFVGIVLLMLYSPRFFALLRAEEKVLHVLTFTELIDKNVLAQFEKETGYAVRLTHFETDDEAYVKIKMNEGRGYDLIVVGEYMTERLKEDGLLRELDHAHITNKAHIRPEFVGHYYDPQLRYSMPLCWQAIGIGYNMAYFGGKRQKLGWDVFFDKNKRYGPSFEKLKAGDPHRDYRVCMFDDYRDSIFLGLLYTYGSIASATDQQLEKVGELLREQKQWVEAYSSDKVEYFLVTGIVPLVMVPSAYMLKVFTATPGFDFVVPEKGSLMVVECMTIPRSCERPYIVHQLINFLLREDVSIANTNRFGNNPTVEVDERKITPFIVNNPNMFPRGAAFSRLHLRRNTISQAKLVDTWVAVKS